MQNSNMVWETPHQSHKLISELPFRVAAFFLLGRLLGLFYTLVMSLISFGLMFFATILYNHNQIPASTVNRLLAIVLSAVGIILAADLLHLRIRYLIHVLKSGQMIWLDNTSLLIRYSPVLFLMQLLYFNACIGWLYRKLYVDTYHKSGEDTNKSEEASTEIIFDYNSKSL